MTAYKELYGALDISTVSDMLGLHGEIATVLSENKCDNNGVSILPF